MRLEPLADGDPVEPRHIHVEQDEVGLARGDRLERLDPVGGLHDLVPQLVEVRLEQLAIRALVVDDEDERLMDRDEPLGHAGRPSFATASRSSSARPPRAAIFASHCSSLA